MTSTNTNDNQSHGQAELTQERLRLKQVCTAEPQQPRATIDKKVVKEYADRLAHGDEFPPVDVFYDGNTYWLADGFHRLEAHEEAKRDVINSTIHQGGQNDAIWFAVQANRKHGLQRTNKDKQRAVKMALQHPKGRELSDGQVATHVGVSDRMVAKYREQMTPKDSESASRTGRDGRTINTAGIGKRTDDDPAPTPKPEPAKAAVTVSRRPPGAGRFPAPESPVESSTDHADGPPPTLPSCHAHDVDADGDRVYEPEPLVTTSAMAGIVMSDPMTPSQHAEQGLESLRGLTEALQALGLHEVHADALGAVEGDLRRYAADEAVATQPDTDEFPQQTLEEGEEVMEWSA